VSGSGHFRGPGGKGANQAVAAARLGAEGALIGRVGADEAGRWLLGRLAFEGVDVSHVGLDPVQPTGLALISVDQSGQNLISVSPGANSALTPDDVQEAASSLHASQVVLCQLEIPPDCVRKAASYAQRLIVNAAPAQRLDVDLLDLVHVLVVNETELAALVGGPAPKDPKEALTQARSLRGPEVIIVTLGPAGAVVASDVDERHVPAPPVESVDSTAAGDAFCGALAVRLADGRDMLSAVRYAVVAGAAATMREGALASLPYPAEIEALV